MQDDGAAPIVRSRRVPSADEREWRIEDRTSVREEAGFVSDGEVASEDDGAPAETAVDDARASIRVGSLSQRDEERFVLALAAGDRATLDELLATAIDPDVEYPPHGPALHTILTLYAGADVVDVVRSLLDRGADPRVLDERDQSPLHAVVARSVDVRTRGPSNAELVRVLVSRGADVDARDDEGATPLLAQLHAGGGTDVVRALLDAGARVDVRDHAGAAPLHAAIASGAGSLERVQLLVGGGADPRAEVDGTSALELARAMRPRDAELASIERWLSAHLGARSERPADAIALLAQLARERPFAEPPRVGRATAVGAYDASIARLLGAAAGDVVPLSGESRSRASRAPYPRERIAGVDVQVAALVRRGELGARAESLRVEDASLAELSLELGMVETLRALATSPGRAKKHLERWLEHAVSNFLGAEREDLVRVLLDAGADPAAIVSRGRGAYAAPMLQSAAGLDRHATARLLVERFTDARKLVDHVEQALPAACAELGALLRGAHRLAGGAPRGCSLEVKHRSRNVDPERARGVAATREHGAQRVLYFVDAPVAAVAEARAGRAIRSFVDMPDATVPWAARWDAIVGWRGNPWTVVVPHPVPRACEAGSIARALGARVLAVGPAAAIEHASDGSVAAERDGDVDAWCAERGAFMCAYETLRDGLRIGLVLRGVWPEAVERFAVVVHDDGDGTLDARDREVLVALASRLGRSSKRRRS
ncbi:Ankyrin 1 [Sandaracinus amylolyticus]|uniref:Ankyrin 1 n=1 Tax=Sandaracinus amylolyticus TaxID=927083 RepID=A0A0F6W1G9_9BACT|nr:Ankyrin 1 [Sandaracinus amylolyticus]